MSDLIILGLAPSSYVRTARMICANKGVDHTLQPVDFHSEAYQTNHHPFSRLPALQHGDVKLFECLAIGTYVDEAFDGPALQPGDPVGRAVMMQWISATNDYIYKAIVGQCVIERIVKPMRGLDPDEATIAAAVPTIAHHLDVVEHRLQQTTYLAGPDLTLADLFLAPVLYYLAATPEGQQLLPQRTMVSKWLDELQQTPDFGTINGLGSNSP